MLVVVQNDPEVPLAAYEGELRDEGEVFSIVRPFAGEPLPAVAGAGAAIVLGGAMGVHDTARHPYLAEVKEFIGGCVRREIPFLGICLGGQLLADVLGAQVLSGQRGEKGCLPVTLTAAGEADPLFAGFDGAFTTFQWHDDTFDIPPGGVLLASSPACPHQAFRVGLRTYGTQFHPEVDPATVEAWVRASDLPGAEGEEILAGFTRNHDRHLLASRRILANFLAMISNRR